MPQSIKKFCDVGDGFLILLSGGKCHEKLYLNIGACVYLRSVGKCRSASGSSYKDNEGIYHWIDNSSYIFFLFGFARSS